MDKKENKELKKEIEQLKKDIDNLKKENKKLYEMVVKTRLDILDLNLYNIKKEL